MGNRPVTNVSWMDAQNYIEWLNAKAGYVDKDANGVNRHPYRYRLATESEWEYAARAGNTGPFGFQNDAPISPERARYDWNESYQGSATRDREYGTTMPVASYAPNAWGLYDMQGTAWEWVQDCYEPDYDKTPRDGSAHQGNEVTGEAFRVLRGGSREDGPECLRSACRKADSAVIPYLEEYGFRIARTLRQGDLIP